MRFYKYPLLGKVLYSKAINRFPDAKGKIFITFDDGPHPEVTPAILKILSKYKAKATFFCLGEYVKLYPAIFKNIEKEGHAIGIHGYSHINGMKCSVQEYLENIDLATQHINSNLFRPPYGKMKIKQYRWIKECFKIVLWDVMSYDFDPTMSIEKIVEKVCSKTKDGSIIVFHDSLKAKDKVLAALPLVLEHFKKYDYCSIKIK
jgi:peptidoglycan/xylan/chitin deacetylase (PgdA/CDA1 family)